MIPFNKPYLSGFEMRYIEDAVLTGKISGNGKYTKLCQDFFEQKYHFKKCLLTTSCTDALEMCAILAEIGPGDEIIIPSYTFVSTALAFIRQGATIIFADSNAENPNIDADLIASLITPKTKAIVPVHYAGIACDMSKIMALAEKHKLFVIEDAAQAIDSYYTFPDGTQKALGSIGHFAAFSFHETKNIISGEGGMLVVNDDQFVHRAEIIWEKGTNRAEFFRGEINKYGWVDTGSSFLPSEIIAAFLWAQLENLDQIQQQRKHIWNLYFELLGKEPTDSYQLVKIPDFATNNAHMFFIVFKDHTLQQACINRLKEQQIMAVFHYLSLHKSSYYKDMYQGEALKWSDHYSDCLVRLPMFYELTDESIHQIVSIIKQ
jgi:dTDP-4-amino-4,6-dideoxygalactose transaminase